jgi:hypothetical protein
MGHFDMQHLSLGILTTPFLGLLIFIKLNFSATIENFPFRILII